MSTSSTSSTSSTMSPSASTVDTTPRRGRTARRAALAAVAVAAAGVATLGVAPAANAQQSAWVSITPGSTVCVSQYASYQVRGDGWADRAVKFSLKRNGVTVSPIPAGTAWGQEFRSSYGTFPGAGVYQACAFNNGFQTATVSLQLRTDYEF